MYVMWRVTRFLCGAVQVLELPLAQVLSTTNPTNTGCDGGHEAMDESSESEDDDDEDDDIISQEVYRLRVETAGTIHCVALWYRMYMHPDTTRTSTEVIDTGPREMGGNDEYSLPHWRQVGFLLETPRALLAGEALSVRVVVDRAIGVWCEVLPQ